MQEIDDLKLLLKAAEDEEVKEPSLFDVDEDEEEDKKKTMRGKKYQRDDDEEEDKKKTMRGKKYQRDDDEDYDDDEEEDDEYDAKYIKKYLKKYAKENEEDFKKFLKDIGQLKKAVDMAAEKADIEDADAVLVEGTEMFKAFSDFAEGVTEALVDIKEKLSEISKIVYGNAAITKANADVVIKATEMIENIGKTPSSFRGVISAPVASEQKQSINTIKSYLLKAAQSGDARAFNAMTKIESCYGNLSLLDKETLNYVRKITEAN